MKDTTNDNVRPTTVNLHLKNKQVITIKQYAVGFKDLQEMIKDNTFSTSAIMDHDHEGRILCLPQGEISYVDCKSDEVDTVADDELPF